jgi:hypothetical protein
MIFNIINLGRSGHSSIMHWLLAQDFREIYIGQGNGKFTDRNWRGYVVNSGKNNTVVTLQERDIDFLNDIKDEIKSSVNNLYKVVILDNCLTQGNHFKTLPNNFPVALEDMTNIIVIRDWYNNFASLLQMDVLNHPNEEKKTNWKKTWIMQAKEALGDTNELPNKYVIKYNQWVVDKKYREKICTDLKLNLTDLGHSLVPINGGGSSFDYNQYSNSANQMKVFERYIKYIDNTNWINSIDDEIIDLNIRLFKFYAPIPFYECNPSWYKFKNKILEQWRKIFK